QGGIVFDPQPAERLFGGIGDEQIILHLLEAKNSHPQPHVATDDRGHSFGLNGIDAFHAEGRLAADMPRRENSAVARKSRQNRAGTVSRARNFARKKFGPGNFGWAPEKIA